MLEFIFIIRVCYKAIDQFIFKFLFNFHVLMDTIAKKIMIMWNFFLYFLNKVDAGNNKLIFYNVYYNVS